MAAGLPFIVGLFLPRVSQASQAPTPAGWPRGGARSRRACISGNLSVRLGVLRA